MARFYKDSDFYYCTYITGPSHCRLGLAFSSEKTQQLHIEKRPPVGGCFHGVLDEAMIESAVLEGVEAAREKTGGNLYPIAIAYVENDSPRHDLFGRTAFCIAERLMSDGHFDDGGDSSWRTTD